MDADVEVDGEEREAKDRQASESRGDRDRD